MAPAPGGDYGTPDYQTSSSPSSPTPSQSPSPTPSPSPSTPPWQAGYSSYRAAQQQSSQSQSLPSANGISQSTETFMPMVESSTASPIYSTVSTSSDYVVHPASTSPAVSPWANETHPTVGGMPTWLLSTIVVIALIVIVVSAIAIFWIIRARRKQRAAAAAGGMPEMKDLAPTRQPDQRAYVRPPSSSPPPTVTIDIDSSPIIPPPHSARSPVPASTPPPTQRESQPVILSTTINQSYYTGLDTSDHVSLSDDRRSQNSVEPYEDGDEPPPPYRPRSVPPISRDASVRTSHTARTSSIARRNVAVSNSTTAGGDHSSTYLMGGVRRSHELRSPFEDPEDEADAASAVSEVTIRPQRHAAQGEPHDRLSVVSDLSYQDEPALPRSSLS